MRGGIGRHTLTMRSADRSRRPTRCRTSRPTSTTPSASARGGDANGRRTTYQYDQADRLLTTNDGATVTTLSWDANGNNTLVQAGASVTTYTWDGENRLTKMALPGGSVVTNTYGSDGLRRKREDGVATVKHLWDGSRLLLESDGSDVTQAVYTSSVGAYGDTVSQRRSNATHYHHPDHLGTIWNLSDSSQTASDSYVFDAWGNQLASTGSTVNPYRYVGALGYYAEPTTALTYVRARWLRPATGSWVSVDPASTQATWAYVQQRPILMEDASGLLNRIGCTQDDPEAEPYYWDIRDEEHRKRWWCYRNQCSYIGYRNFESQYAGPGRKLDSFLRLWYEAPAEQDKEGTASLERLRLALECIIEAESTWDTYATGPTDDHGLFMLVLYKGWTEAVNRRVPAGDPRYFDDKRLEPNGCSTWTICAHEANVKAGLTLLARGTGVGAKCNAGVSIWQAVWQKWVATHDRSSFMFPKCVSRKAKMLTFPKTVAPNHDAAKEFLEQRNCPRQL